MLSSPQSSQEVLGGVQDTLLIQLRSQRMGYFARHLCYIFLCVLAKILFQDRFLEVRLLGQII